MTQQEILKIFAQDEEVRQAFSLKQSDIDSVKMNGPQPHIMLSIFRDLIELEAKKDSTTRIRKVQLLQRLDSYRK